MAEVSDDSGDRLARARAAARAVACALLGVALGLSAAFCALHGRARLFERDSRFGTREKSVPSPGQQARLAGSVLPEDTGSIGEILVHYTPGLEPLVADAYADFLGTLSPATRIVAVVPKPDERERVDRPRDRVIRLWNRINPSGALAARTRVVAVDGPISVWSKDRALVMAPDAAAGERTGLVIPAPPDRRWRERSNDWRTLAQVAHAMPDRYYVRELPLAFDAGDFEVANGRIVVDSNLVTKNRARGVDSVDRLRALVEGLFGRQVVVLGAADGDVPRHHLSMYMAALDRGVALVGDPRAAKAVLGGEFAPGEVDPDTGDALRADFSDATIERFERAAEDLRRAGWSVLRIPEVPFLDKTYMAYTNGVYEARGGARVAWMPTFDIPELDSRARRIYEALGWEVRAVRARALYPYHGTIGCLVNVLARAK
jgi:hypothetical protein